MKGSLLENIAITDTAADGKSVARYGELVLFVEKGVPGDVADVRIRKKKKNFAEGSLERLVKPSENRTDPFCTHFGICGGCKWQNMSYEAQLHFKQKQAEDALLRIGKLEIKEMLPIIPSSTQQQFRNKLEYTFSSRRWLTKSEMDKDRATLSHSALGFHIPGLFDRVVDIEQCFLQPEPTNQIRNAVKKFVLEKGYTFHDIRKHEGLLRNLIVRNSSDGQVMVILVLNEDVPEGREELMNFITDEFPGITSLYYIINPKWNDAYGDLEAILYRGQPFLTERMDDLTFRIGPKSFFQTNPSQALSLYRKVKEWGAFTGTEHVYDLYTGTGTIACFVARQVRKVTGVEYIEAAIKDAEENARLNHISNISFHAGDMKDMLTDRFLAEHGRPDVIITDPPRAGMHPDVVMKILEINPEKIIYVSCNPSTQARDLAMIAENYSFEISQPVDMFPHTAHVENIVLAQRKSY